MIQFTEMKNIVLPILLLPIFTLAQNFNLNHNKDLEKKVESVLKKLSLEEKIGQTCQITLDAVLQKEANGNLSEPMAIDPQKLEEAINQYHVGSILNVGWHTFKLEEWEYVMDNIHQPYQSKKTKVPIIYGIDAIHGVNYTVGATLFLKKSDWRPPGIHLWPGPLEK